MWAPRTEMGTFGNYEQNRSREDVNAVTVLKGMCDLTGSQWVASNPISPGSIS
jgi:hypothetical protein